MQKMSDASVEKCEKCAGRVEKLISQSSFALKGSGWYQTDYAKKDKKCDTATEKCAGCPSAK
jgi:predicted nucleic acid-binding Zn ribbon protein